MFPVPLLELLLLAAMVLAFFLPGCLIDAIRAEEEEKAQSSRNMACVIFGFLVIVALLAIRS